MYVCSLEYFYKSIIILINWSIKSKFIIRYSVAVAVAVAVVVIVIYCNGYILFYCSGYILLYCFLNELHEFNWGMLHNGSDFVSI